MQRKEIFGVRVTFIYYHCLRSGTLWEGRYKSCLVQSEQYLLELYRYIELNPVRAHAGTDLLQEIRRNINKWLALENDRFTSQIEALTKQLVTARKPGRPRQRNIDEA